MLKRLKAFSILVIIGFFLIVSRESARTAGLQQQEALRAEGSREGLEFFEKKVRPVLAENCYGCHSDRGKKPQGELRLDMMDWMLRGGASGKPAVMPGDPEKSLLILAVRQTDAKLQMPPGDKLTPEQIKDLEQWIKMGAPAPKDKNTAVAVTTYDWNEAKKFWSFQPVKSVVPPKIKNEAWAKSAIDRFILAKLEEKGLKPIGDADKLTLIRRATFDLTGLPPTPEEIDGFLADRSPQAFEKVVDRLLASPSYGEKWGRHWLDVVRYADTAGDNSDYPVPAGYRYRNYVIESYNQNKPYDQFIREQIAGDLLPSATEKEKHEQIIATGYLAMSRRFGSRNENMNLTIDDTIDNLGKTFLGLSTACARCHDHKFDPIPTKDYYALYGIFNSSRYSFPGSEIYKHPAEYVALESGEKAQKFYRQQQELNDLDDRHEFLVAEKGTAARNKKAKEQAARDAAQPEAAAPKTEKEKRVEPAKNNNESNDKNEVQKAEPKPEIPNTTVTGYPLRPADYNRDADNWGRAGQSKRMPEENDAELVQVNTRIAELHAQLAKVDKAYAVVEGLPKNARVHRKGEIKNLGDEVPRGFLTILGGQQLPADYKGSGRDLLAGWIASAKNPLTSRVMVNRIWEYHFGKGLVQTPNDFGARGKGPTHAELLDWLANRFVADGWSVKKMHKLMMLSRVYQLASVDSTGRRGDGGMGRVVAANATIDVNNDYLWRFNRRRLEAEEIRDAILAVSGTLDRSVGGEHPFPAETTWRFTQHEQFFATYDTNRRSIYVMQQRLKKHPFFEVFDGADQSATTDVRGQSITPVQALFLMNSPLLHEQSDQFAVRVGLAFDRLPEQINCAFRLAYGRPATLPEIKEAASYLQQTRQELATANMAEEKLNRAALASYLRVVLGSNEFLYVD